MNNYGSQNNINKNGIASMPFLACAKWIGAPSKTTNTDAVDTYAITADFCIERGGSVCFAIAARNKDNYMLIEISNSYTAVSEVENGVSSLCAKYYVKDVLKDKNRALIEVDHSFITVTVNGTETVSRRELIPHDIPNKLRKAHMMNFGLPQKGKAVYSYIKIENTTDGAVYRESDFSDDSDILSALGTIENGALTVEDTFFLINPVPPVNVRKFFDVRKGIQSAVLYASARGFYDTYINGVKVNTTFYNPGFTDYRKRIYYQTYDVTDKIKQGENTIGATVAKGYYTGCCGYSGAMVYGEQNSFIGALVIEYDDGTRDVIITDEAWQFTDKCAVLDADYQQGESHDARMALDWSAADNRWRQCGVHEQKKYAEPTNGTLQNELFELNPQPDCGAVLERTLKPVAPAWEKPKNHFVFDFGQNMVGTVRLNFNGLQNRTFKIRYGEMCHRDGSIYNENFRNAANIDTCTMQGGSEEFFPAFTEHGFRYIEISGCGETITKEDFDRMEVRAEGIVITNTPEVTGTFECSNNDINKLFENIMWGQRGNSLLTYTDCPQRNERMGWTGDAQVFAKTAAYNMNVREFMKKYLTDMRDSQLMFNLGGAVPDTAPLGGDNRPHGGCTGWGDASVIVPWEMYKAYGDIDFLKDNYEMMKNWVGYQNRPDRQTGFIQHRQYRGDHLALDKSTPFILSATAYAANSARILSKIAHILGKDDDSNKYNELYINIKRAFNEKWVNADGTIHYISEESGAECEPSQTAYALAIDFGLIDGGKLEGAKNGLKKALDSRGGKLSVGFLGISHIMNALTKEGLIDEAFALLENTDYPSWLYSVKNGATTIWERWNSYIAETDTFADANMNSFNHYAYGAVGEWLFGSILGINTSEETGETGYKKIILKPTAGGSLTWARGSLKTRYGTIKSEWKKENGTFTYKCAVPENTSAVLHLGGKEIQLENGNYEFTLSPYFS